MTIEEAKKMLEEKLKGFSIENSTKEDIIEIAQFLLNETGDTFYAEIMGAEYLSINKPDQALKYMKLAYENNPYESLPLANFYYEGKYIAPDYAKAYEYLKVALTLKDKGDGSFYNSHVTVEKGALKMLADMYENGHYLEKDMEKRDEIIEKLYERQKNGKWFEDRVDILIKMAEIKEKKGQFEKAYNDYARAASDCINLLRYKVFEDHYDFARKAVTKLHTMSNINPRYYLDLIPYLDLRYDMRISFNDIEYDINTEENGGDIAVFFNGKWFRSVKDFFFEAEVNGERLVENPNKVKVLGGNEVERNCKTVRWKD